VSARAVLALALTCTGGCATHSRAGRFVTDLDIRGNQLVVVDCDVNYDVQETLNGKTTKFTTSECNIESLPLQRPSDVEVSPSPGAAR
jgi:hypothetical protein